LARNNRILWNGYRDTDISFPFERLQAPALTIHAHWSVPQLIEYMQTWSAYKRSRQDTVAAAALDALLANARECLRSASRWICQCPGDRGRLCIQCPTCVARHHLALRAARAQPAPAIRPGRAPSREIPTPSGDFPTGIRSDTSRVARSTARSEPLGWSLTYRRRPSGVAAMPCGLPPVLMWPRPGRSPCRSPTPCPIFRWDIGKGAART